MTSTKQYDRPGPQRSEHASHGMSLAKRQRLAAGQHEPGYPHGAHGHLSSQPQGEVTSFAETGNADSQHLSDKHRLSWEMWRMHDDIEANAVSLDSALRHTLLWLGGVLLPLAGLALYVLSQAR